MRKKEEKPFGPGWKDQPVPKGPLRNRYQRVPLGTDWSFDPMPKVSFGIGLKTQYRRQSFNLGYLVPVGAPEPKPILRSISPVVSNTISRCVIKIIYFRKLKFL